MRFSHQNSDIDFLTIFFNWSFVLVEYKMWRRGGRLYIQAVWDNFFAFPEVIGIGHQVLSLIALQVSISDVKKIGVSPYKGHNKNIFCGGFKLISNLSLGSQPISDWRGDRVRPYIGTRLLLRNRI